MSDRKQLLQQTAEEFKYRLVHASSTLIQLIKYRLIEEDKNWKRWEPVSAETISVFPQS